MELPPEAAGERPGVRAWPFVAGWLRTQAGLVPKVRPAWGKSDYLGALAVRLGIGRDNYRIAPGLYALGEPTRSCPVIVTANYKLTFDTLRRELAGRSCWILVVETYGINVWCAAGKRSFSTDEVAARVKAAHLDKVVSHRTLILPQLAMPGVAAYKLRKLCGFKAVVGPVRASDLPAFLDAEMKADAAMRRVSFSLAERLTVAFVEIRANRLLTLNVFVAVLILAAVGPGGFTFGGTLAAAAGAFGVYLLGFLAGCMGVPALLPHLPFRPFAAKGLVLGAAVGFLAACGLARALPEGVAMTLACTAWTSWFAMHYTGSSTFTSLSGVDKEMRRYIPVQAGLLLAAILTWLVVSWMGGAS